MKGKIYFLLNQVIKKKTNIRVSFKKNTVTHNAGFYLCKRKVTFSFLMSCITILMPTE